MACGAHRVLAVRRGGAGTCLLGVSDDVDCAVVELAVSRASDSSDAAAAAEQPTASAAHPADNQAAADTETQHRSQQEGSQPQICATHVASIPALAYVAAGKTQRKALLLAPPGDASLLCFARPSLLEQCSVGAHAVLWHSCQAGASPQR